MTDHAIDMEQVSEIAESVCAQLAAYGERADADWLTLASACGLAAGMFLAGNLEPASARHAWNTLSSAVADFVIAAGEQDLEQHH
jgi:hypothetical protein